MTAGYSNTPLVKKLGIKDGFKVLFVNQPTDYLNLLGQLPDVVEAADQKNIDFIHYFTKCKSELESEILSLKGKLAKTGTLWVSWPKKSSNVDTDLDGNIVRLTGLNAGLVDVKVCAVSDIWSGLKFMYRKKDR